MSEHLELPAAIQDAIAEMPEYKYGVNLVTLTLDDGTEIRDVYVAWAKDIIKVGYTATVLFDATRVVSAQSQV